MFTIIAPPYINEATMHGAQFMHELGHNLDLKYDGWFLDEAYHPFWHHSCMNYYYFSSYTDYTDEEWDSLELDFYPRLDVGG